MKKVVAICLCLMLFNLASAQVLNPVQWNYTVKRINESTYTVQIAATLEPGWHVYAQDTPEGGPLPTRISFSSNPLVTLEGPPKEVGKLEQKHEPLFGVDVRQYANHVVFVQTVKVKGKARTALAATVEFMACNNETCLPPRTQKFSIALK